LCISRKFSPSSSSLWAINTEPSTEAFFPTKTEKQFITDLFCPVKPETEINITSAKNKFFIFFNYEVECVLLTAKSDLLFPKAMKTGNIRVSLLMPGIPLLKDFY
jgi:hypothetical protein